MLSCHCYVWHFIVYVELGELMMTNYMLTSYHFIALVSFLGFVKEGAVVSYIYRLLGVNSRVLCACVGCHVAPCEGWLAHMVPLHTNPTPHNTWPAGNNSVKVAKYSEV